MLKTEELKLLLEDLIQIYADDEVTIEFGDSPKISKDGVVYIPTDASEIVGEEIDGIQDFRVLLDSASHEGHHHKLTDLTSLERIQKEIPGAPNLAATAFNIIEDVYINKYRVLKYKGQRNTLAFKISKWMDNYHTEYHIGGDEISPEDITNGMIQLSYTGTVNGISTCESKDVLDFFTWCDMKYDEVRETAESVYTGEKDNDPQYRLDIAKEITNKLMELLGDKDNISQANRHAGMTQDSVPGQPFRPVSPRPKVLDNELEDIEDGDFEIDLDEDLNIEIDDENYNGFDSIDSDSESENEEGNNTKNCDERNGESSEKEKESGNDTDLESDITNSSEGSESESKSNKESEFERKKEELQNRSEDMDVGDWYNVSDNHDFEKPTRYTRQRYEKLLQKVNSRNEDIEVKKRERDEILQRTESHSEKIKRQMMNEYKEDIKDAFKQFKTRDRDVPVEVGEEVHVDNAIQYLSGDTTIDKLHQTRNRIETGDRVIGCAVDLSGSVSMEAVRTTLGAFQMATDIIGDDFLAVGFKTANSHSGNNHESIETPLIVSHDEEFDWKYMDIVQTSGRTPTASGIQTTFNFIQQSPKASKVMIVITDGLPNVYLSDSGEVIGDKKKTIERAKDHVKTIKMNGVKVIGVGVGSRLSNENMNYIFGHEDIEMTDRANLTNTLVDVYRRQMDVNGV